MLRKLFLLPALAVLAIGWSAFADDTLPGGGSIPFEPDPDCEEFCDPVVTLPDGTLCVLEGCLSGGGEVYCLYSCFWQLPPGP